MNKKRRMKNRATAQWLEREIAPPCPNCGQKGPHFVGVPMTLGDLLAGTEPDGFWLCDMYYGEDGRRLPSNEKSEPTAPLLAQVGSTDGLGVAVPPAPTFGDKA